MKIPVLPTYDSSSNGLAWRRTFAVMEDETSNTILVVDDTPSQGGVYLIAQQCTLAGPNPQGSIKWQAAYGAELIEITGTFNEHDSDQPHSSCSINDTGTDVGLKCTVVRVAQDAATAFPLDLDDITVYTYAQYVYTLSEDQPPPETSNLSFADPDSFDIGGTPGDSIAIADANGDGKPDIATAVDGALVYLPGTLGYFDPVATASIPPNRFVTSVAPVVIDGESDVAYTWYQIYEQTGGDPDVSGVDFVRHPNTGPGAAATRASCARETSTPMGKRTTSRS